MRVHHWTIVTFCNMLDFIVRGYWPPSNLQAGGHSITGYPWLLIKYIHSYTLCLEAFSSIHNLKMCHGVVESCYELKKNWVVWSSKQLYSWAQWSTRSKVIPQLRTELIIWWLVRPIGICFVVIDEYWALVE